MSDPFDLTGKVALVTGGSRGIGAAIITAFAARGARCVINYVTDPQGQNEPDARELASKCAGALVIQCDVGDSTQVAAMFREIEIHFGGLDLLINNAGILRDRTIKKMSDDEWAAVMNVNLTGAFRCLRAASSLLRRGGSVVNIASVAGQAGFFGEANYSASKAGLIALTKVAARELAKQDVTVNAVAPGFIDTELIHDLPPQVVADILAHTPQGHYGEPADIVHAVLFFCSRDARYITGQILNVNGGFYM